MRSLPHGFRLFMDFPVALKGARYGRRQKIVGVGAWHTLSSGADLTFAPLMLRLLHANVKSEAPQALHFLVSFAKVPAEKGCECWNRSTGARFPKFVRHRGNLYTNFGKQGHQQIFDSSAAFDLKSLRRFCRG
jgi:hypothetical protein